MQRSERISPAGFVQGSEYSARINTHAYQAFRQNVILDLHACDTVCLVGIMTRALKLRSSCTVARHVADGWDGRGGVRAQLTERACPLSVLACPWPGST